MPKFEHPDYREIDTPWEPQSIAWRYISTEPGISRRSGGYDAIVAQAEDPAHTHIVREVEVAVSPQAGLLTIQQTLDDLTLAQEHFDLLASYPGLAVAMTQWHVFADSEGETRTLARVEIIDGDELKFMHPSERGILTDDAREALENFDRGIKRYSKELIGAPLNDVGNLYQWRFGVPRTQEPSPLAVKALHLIDIEPIFYFRGRRY
ncbi:MAG: hypothetical protein JWM52_712 [Candidatus Saccharibacteria bacterium]|nr:hypothetical protein [Candidatus Saccharibacteria bacterium]